jgi:hypothetical protein
MRVQEEYTGDGRTCTLIAGPSDQPHFNLRGSKEGRARQNFWSLFFESFSASLNQVQQVVRRKGIYMSRLLVFVLLVTITTVVFAAEPHMVWLSPRNVTNLGK